MNKIKILRQELHMTQNTFASKLGITATTISKIENNERNITNQMIILICKQFNVNENWLTNGDGPIFKDNNQDIQLEESLELFNNLNSHFKEYTLQQMRELLKLQKKISK